MRTRPLDRLHPRSAAARATVRPAGFSQTPSPHTYSVRAEFVLGGTAWNNRVTITATQFNFMREVERAFVDALGLRGVIVQSAAATVGPERVQDNLLDDSGQWPVRLEARFASPVLLNRDEWLAVLAKAFLWAYRVAWYYRDSGNGYTASTVFGSSGSPTRFVEAANRSDDSDVVIRYVGGSMLDLGPAGSSPARPAMQPADTDPPRRPPQPVTDGVRPPETTAAAPWSSGDREPSDGPRESAQDLPDGAPQAPEGRARKIRIAVAVTLATVAIAGVVASLLVKPAPAASPTALPR